MTATAPSPAAPVFVLELPLSLAPTQNKLMSLVKRARGRRCYELDNLKREIAQLVMVAKKNWPEWWCGDKRHESMRLVAGMPRVTTIVEGGRRRRVVVTRYSSRQPDEESVDVLGGKCALDALVKAGVLRDDSVKWCQREAKWERAKPGDGKLVVEVFEL